MNLEAASHVVLYHGNMTPNERQQIIGVYKIMEASQEVRLLHQYSQLQDPMEFQAAGVDGLIQVEQVK